MSDAKKPLDLSRYEGHTKGEWVWENRHTDEPLGPKDFEGSLRTVEQFPTLSVGTLPKFILSQVEEWDNPIDLVLIADAPALLAEVIALRAALRQSNLPQCGGCSRYDGPCEPGCVVAEALGEEWRGE